MASGSNPTLNITGGASKPTYADKASARKKRAEALKSLLLEIFSKESGKDSNSESLINALAETFSYTSLTDEEIRSKNFQHMRQAYVWAAANSTIAFPYLTLEKASKELKSSLDALPSWGVVKDNTIYVPAPNEDREIWSLLVYLYEANKPANVKVSYLTEEDSTVPDLGNDAILKRSGAMETILMRLLELSKNPYSATIRTGIKITNKDIYKNAIDFVFLDKIYRKNKADYDNLEFSDVALRNGRRVERVESKQGNKTFYSSVYLGYKLSEYLLANVERNDNKIKESAPFCRFIYSIIDAILEKSPVPDKYDLPKTLFKSPNNSVRADIRRGPVIRTKKGEKDNLYSPFTFVKSTECEGMPDHIKKAATDLSAKVINQIDQINKLSCKEASHNLPLYKDYLYLAYIYSDKARKAWRKDLQCPRYSEIAEILDSVITSQSKVKNVTFDAERIRALKITPQEVTYESPIESEEDRALCKKAIEEASEKRRKGGRNTSA